MFFCRYGAGYCFYHQYSQLEMFSRSVLGFKTNIFLMFRAMDCQLSSCLYVDRYMEIYQQIFIHFPKTGCVCTLVNHSSGFIEKNMYDILNEDQLLFIQSSVYAISGKNSGLLPGAPFTNMV